MKFSIELSDTLLLHVRRMRLTNELQINVDALSQPYRDNLSQLEEFSPSITQEELATAHLVLATCYGQESYEHTKVEIIKDPQHTPESSILGEATVTATPERKQHSFIMPQTPFFQSLGITGTEQLLNINAKGVHPPQRTQEGLDAYVEQRVHLESVYGKQHARWMSRPFVPSSMRVMESFEDLPDYSIIFDVSELRDRFPSVFEDSDTSSYSDDGASEVDEDIIVHMEPPLPGAGPEAEAYDTEGEAESPNAQVTSTNAHISFFEEGPSFEAGSAQVKVWQFDQSLDWANYDDEDDDDAFYARHLASLRAVSPGIPTSTTREPSLHTEEEPINELAYSIPQVNIMSMDQQGEGINFDSGTPRVVLPFRARARPLPLLKLDQEKAGFAVESGELSGSSPDSQHTTFSGTDTHDTSSSASDEVAENKSTIHGNTNSKDEYWQGAEEEENTGSNDHQLDAIMSHLESDGWTCSSPFEPLSPDGSFDEAMLLCDSSEDEGSISSGQDPSIGGNGADTEDIFEPSLFDVEQETCYGPSLAETDAAAEVVDRDLPASPSDGLLEATVLSAKCDGSQDGVAPAPSDVRLVAQLNTVSSTGALPCRPVSTKQRTPYLSFFSHTDSGDLLCGAAVLAYTGSMVYRFFRS